MARPPRPKRHVGTDGTVTIAGKNPNGAGSTYFHQAKGRWVATYVDPNTAKVRTVTAATKGDAEARRTAKVAELIANRPTSVLGPDPTFAALAAWWLETTAPSLVRPNTLRSYEQDVRRLTAELGTVRVSDVDPGTAQSAIAAIRKTFGHGTTVNARARLRQILEAAVDLELLPRNPATKVAVPKATEAERAPKRTLSPAEVTKLLAVLDPEEHRYDAAVSILFTAGVRCSEALGLAWSDIDLDAGTATIARGCTYTPATGFRLDEPKTKRTVGSIQLHPAAVAALRAHRLRQNAERLAAGPAWETTTYEGAELAMVFTDRRGRLTREQAVGQALSDALTRAGMEASKSTHMGRRSVITALSEAGTPTDDIADYVGHASTDTTRRYVQSRAERSRDVAQRAHALFAPAVDQ